MFNSSKCCLYFETLLGWSLSQGWRLAIIDQIKQYLSLFLKFTKAFDLKDFEHKKNHLFHKFYRILSSLSYFYQKSNLIPLFLEFEFEFDVLVEI